jgi:hypothetical protein
MKLTLDGEEFDLTSERVRARLVGQTPDGVHEYWVEIDGVRWPVKQVVALATGASTGRFVTQSARRWLLKLGFVVGKDSQPLQRARVTSSSRTPRLDLEAQSELPADDVRVVVPWRQAGDVVLDADGLPMFPRLPGAPGLYRMEFKGAHDGLRTWYIGESASLARRASNYRNAKNDRSQQLTSRRIHKEIVAHLQSGLAIDLAATTRVQINGVDADLLLRSVRRLAENAAVFLAQQDPAVRVLNIDAASAVGGES